MPVKADNTGRYPREQGEELTLICKGARVEVGVLEVEQGWILRLGAEYRCGNFSGFLTPYAEPNVRHPAYPTKAAAILHGLEMAKAHFEVSRFHESVKESQREAAVEMTKLIEARIRQEQQASLFP